MLLFVFLVLLFVACKETNVLAEKNEVIYTSDTLKQGKPFTIICNTKMDTNYFSKDKKYQALLLFFTSETEKYYRLDLKPSQNNSAILISNFVVPNNAISCHIGIYEEEQDMEKYAKHYPIYNSDGKMREGTALQMLFNTKDDNKFNELVEYEFYNYPKNFDNYSIPLLLIAFRGHLDYVNERAKELQNSYSEEKDTLNKKERLFYLATSAFCLFLAGDLKNSLAMLDTAITSIDTTDKSLVKSGIFKNNLQNIPFQLFEKNNDSIRKLEIAILNRIIKIAIKTKNDNLMINVVRNLFRKFSQNYKNDDFNILLNQLYKRIIELNNSKDYLYFYVYADLFHIFPRVLSDCGYIEEAEKIYKLAIDFSTKAERMNRTSKDTNDYVFNSFNDYHRLLGIYFELGQFYVSQSEYEQAKTAFSYLLNDTHKISNFNIGVISLSSIKMIEIYLKENNLDSANYYLLKAFKYGSPFAKDKFAEINKIKSQKKIDTISIAEYYKINSIKTYKYNNLTINQLNDINKKVIKLREQKDTIIFIFNIKDDCAICNIGVIQLCEQYPEFKKQLPCKVILLSNLPAKELQNSFGKEVSFVRKNKELESAFLIKKDDVTNCIVVRNNTFMNYQSYPNTFDELIELSK